MQMLTARLDQLGRLYHLQVGPLLLLLAIGISSAPVLGWTAGLLLCLLSANRLHMSLVRERNTAG